MNGVAWTLYVQMDQPCFWGFAEEEGRSVEIMLREEDGSRDRIELSELKFRVELTHHPSSTRSVYTITYSAIERIRVGLVHQDLGKRKTSIMPDQLTQHAKMAKTQAHTALTEKAYSPLIIRKTTRFGFPIFVALITDDDLDDLDNVVGSCVKEHIDLWKSNSIQDKRNLGGILSDALSEHYGKVEGVAVIMAIDKMMVSSLFGDFMNHTPCRLELYTLLNMMTNI